MINPIPDGGVTSADGFEAGVATAKIKLSSNRDDVCVVYSAQPCATAGVFTTNQVVAAPVIVSRDTLAANADKMHGFVVNSGNANACTGDTGMADAQAMQATAAQALGCAPADLLVMSTGVIGQPLPMDRMTQGIVAAVGAKSADNGNLAARAIMTTDTVAKEVAVKLELPTGTVTLGGMVKGAGMLHPNMATMLGAVTTDAACSAAFLQRALKSAVSTSFNRISVDGDTSTNDTILAYANGSSGVSVMGKHAKAFRAALTHICTQLAQMVVRDGEGASKFVEIQVSGTASHKKSHMIANTIATSPLVKTAFAGSDANWGRIMAAAGRAGVKFDQHAANLWFSADGKRWLQVLENGGRTSYLEEDAAAIFAESDIWVKLSVGEGKGKSTVWTSDLTHEYVSINADYRT